MSRKARWIGAGALVGCLAAVACGKKASEPRADGSADASKPAAKAAVGQPAPDFEVSDEAGNTVRLSDHRGKRPVMLAFYPKDFTSG